MQDLYRSRKGQGSLAIEMESLKSDNEHLIVLLKNTCEYADFSDDQIMRAASTKHSKGSKGLNDIMEATKGARG